MTEENPAGGTTLGEVEALDEGSLRVAPTTGTDRATLRTTLRVVACWRLNDHMFEFASSFVSPDLAAEMPALGGLLEKFAGSPASLFGHADPVGNDADNQILSGRRAKATYALLTRKPEIWEELFVEPHLHDDWGNRSIQLMLRTIGHAPEGGDPFVLEGDPNPNQTSDPAALAAALGQQVPYYTGPITKTRTEATTVAIRRFQKDHRLHVDGDPGPETRKVLFNNYMDAICANDAGVPFSMPAESFVGKGSDAGGHADFQACSEFNPVLVFSQDEERAFQRSTDKSARDGQNATNRRVMLLFFDPDVPIEASEWPCPRIREGAEPCRKFFWPDGDARRAPTAKRRRFSASGDTFACRFYELVARRSPCEGVKQQVIELRLFDDQVDPQPAYDAQYRVVLPNGRRAGTAPDGVVRLTVVDPPPSVDIEWSLASDPPLTLDGGTPRFRLTVNVDVDSGDPEQNAARRLHNLGFPESDGFKNNLLAFQRDYGLPRTGTLDSATSTRIQEVHDSAEPDPQLAQVRG